MITSLPSFLVRVTIPGCFPASGVNPAMVFEPEAPTKTTDVRGCAFGHCVVIGIFGPLPSKRMMFPPGCFRVKCQYSK